MKTKIRTSLLVWGLLLRCGALTYAADITFTSSGTISGTENYDIVNVQNDGTVLQILGGTVGWLSIHDTARVEMYGGYINETIFAGTGGFLINGGVLSGAIVGGATIDINGGDLNLPYGYIKTRDATINIRGGVTPLGGDFGIYLDGYGGAVNIYGYGFVSDPIHYQISGNLADGNPFMFQTDSATYEKTNLITPEPISLCLLAIGGLILRA